MSICQLFIRSRVMNTPRRFNLLSSSRAVTAILVVLAGVPACPAQDPVRITSVELDDEDFFRFVIEAPAGELLVEDSVDFTTWTPLVPIGSTGDPVEVSEGRAGLNRFYRVLGFPDSDDQHLNGPVAQALRLTVPYGDLQAVFGLGPGPPASPVTQVRDLPTADQDARVYAAAIGLLSVLGNDLLDSVTPQPSIADVIAALLADLASGSLDGHDPGGGRVAVGSGGALLPEYTDENLAAAAAQLEDELSGLRNVDLQAGGGQVSTSAPADWNTFYWDSSGWQ